MQVSWSILFLVHIHIHRSQRSCDKFYWYVLYVLYWNIDEKRVDQHAFIHWRSERCRRNRRRRARLARCTESPILHRREPTRRCVTRSTLHGKACIKHEDTEVDCGTNRNYLSWFRKRTIVSRVSNGTRISLSRPSIEYENGTLWETIIGKGLETAILERYPQTCSQRVKAGRYWHTAGQTISE